MFSLQNDLGVVLPVLAAPMAGGPSTTSLVTAAADVGALGFLAGGYTTAEGLAAQIDAMRASRGGGAFGVNLFAPNPIPVPVESYRTYQEALERIATRYAISLSAVDVREDDDQWDAKLDVLLTHPVPLVSFTFGVPERSVVDRLRRAGTVVAQSVTAPAEAELARSRGVDVVIVQGNRAGGHSATLTPDRAVTDTGLADLVGQIRHETGLPVIAAGGLSAPAEVAAIIASGAAAAMVGTALLLTPESGTTTLHRAMLLEQRDTVITRAFTGRPARALRNEFTTRFSDVAPLGYPALHHLTRPLRAAAVAAGDAEVINAWAGTGHRHARPRPAAEVLTSLGSQL